MSNVISLGYKCYDASVLEKRALKRISRDSLDYKIASSWVFDTTSACNREEAISWLEHYMSQALSYCGEPIYDVIHKGIILVNSKAEAGALWLASYDFYKSLVGQK